MRKTLAMNSKIMKAASTLHDAIIAETEEILEDTEKAIKEVVPACDVNKALTAVEESLNDEGIEAEFDKKMTREDLRKSASEELDKDDLNKLVKKIVDAVVKELEDVLADADEVADEEVAKLADGEDEGEVIEGKFKSLLEKKLASVGIYAKLERKAKPVEKKVEKVAASDKIAEAFAAKRSSRK